MNTTPPSSRAFWLFMLGWFAFDLLFCLALHWFNH
jgi:hypothetical protein